jgi:hypothetical protein
MRATASAAALVAGARSWEVCTTSAGVAVARPVIRLQLDGRPVILTRVDPDARSTSLIIR